MRNFIQVTQIIANKKGLHARVATQIVNIAQQFQSEIMLCYQDRQANAKNILELLTLAAAYQETVQIKARGQDAQAAITALTSLFENKFGELN